MENQRTTEEGTRKWIMVPSADTVQVSMMDEISNVIANSAAGLRSVLEQIASVTLPDQLSESEASDPDEDQGASSTDSGNSMEEANENEMDIEDALNNNKRGSAKRKTPPLEQEPRAEDFGRFFPVVFSCLYVAAMAFVLFYFGDAVK